MDSANNLKKLLTLQEASQRLSVPIETLLEWNEHHILKPTITQDGQIGYTEEQLNQFLKIRQAVSAGQTNQETSLQDSSDQKIFAKQQSISVLQDNISGKVLRANFFQSIIKRVGKIFYVDEYIKDFLKSQVQESLTFRLRLPSKKFALVTACVIAVTGLTLFTQQYRLKFLVEKYQGLASKQQLTTASDRKVLGSSTSRLKLTGNIVFSLPLIVKEKVFVDKEDRKSVV